MLECDICLELLEEDESPYFHKEREITGHIECIREYLLLIHESDG